MPFGQTRIVDGGIVVDGPTVVDGMVVEGTVVEGTVVEGTVVEGTVVDVDCGTVVAENGAVEGVVEGEMLGVSPTILLPPALELPSVGVEPTVLPSWLCGVPVMLGLGVTAPGVVPTAPGVVVAAAPGAVVAAPGAAAPAPGAPTWESAGNAARAAASRSGRRTGSSMEVSFIARAE
jgi:hypothetical protein